ncbi:3-hydroxyacyl-CoA dehydrogenase family protein [Lachnoclostridium edouardi]|uniref:3-hydroxyacyl-CoA dehydrogenase family protein n=1 Tax=Lachnoclostridium edouardi TaxID=1926283 RepID=UPI000C7A2F6C|nr:3-hydroxyacyl-CoA dehydrogenase family protein [Lachnoclostridium edouardi]
MSKSIQNILVVGAGLMGSGIAQVFAANGYKTTVADLKQEFVDKAMKKIDSDIAEMKEEGLADDAYGAAVKENLTGILNSQIPEVAGQMDLVVEVIFENKDAKKELYQTLSNNCKENCIFASNTSGMDIFSLTDDFMKRPERMIITHWFNPPHLMKLVEVVKGPKTSDETAETIRALLEKCGKEPAVLNKFMPGFIVNRMATAICRELYYMVEQGWASPQDLENAMKNTNGLRWGFEGPLGLWDFVGLNIPATVAADVIPTLCSGGNNIPYVDRLIAEGKTGVRAGEGGLGKYPADIDAFIRKRNKRILTMYKVLEGFAKEDEQE